MRIRREIPILVITGNKNGEDAPPESDRAQANLSTIFKDLDSITAEGSMLVLGLTSHLVNPPKLLRSVFIKSCASGWDVPRIITTLNLLLYRLFNMAAIKRSKYTLKP